MDERETEIRAEAAAAVPTGLPRVTLASPRPVVTTVDGALAIAESNAHLPAIAAQLARQ